MRGIITAFAKNTVFANFATVSLLLIGILSGYNMVREIFPEFSLDIVTVRVVWPGADPEDVEEGICAKIEEAIDGLEGIKEYSSTASENVGSILIEVKQNVNIDDVKERIRNAVDAISTFPEDAEEPIIEELVFREEVLVVGLSGEGVPERTLKEFAETIKEEMRRLPELSQVRVLGTRDYEISIELSEERLREYGLTFGQVAGIVRASNLNLGGGTIRTQGEEIRLRTIGKKYTGPDFGKIEVLARPSGEIITLDRIASIRDGFTEDPVTSTLDGLPTVSILALKTKSEDSLAIADAVKAYVATRSQELPEGIKLSIWNDQSKALRDRIRLLTNDGLLGMMLIFMVLWLFLDIRLSFWVGMGMPIAAAGALGMLYFMGETLNMISLFGLIMVLGIIVDDANVIGEAIYVHRKMGKGPLEAAIDGVMEVGMPVMGALFTSIIAFMPLLYVSGISGRFISILPVTVICCLIVSIFEVLLLFPSHLSHLPDPNEKVESSHPIRRFGQRFHAMTSGGLEWFAEHIYVPFLATSLRWRYVTLCIAIAILFLTMGVMQSGMVKYEVLPELDSDLISSTIEFSEGTPVGVTKDAVRELEEALQRLEGKFTTISGDPLVKHVYTISGATVSDGPEPPRYGSHLGSVRAELLEAEKRGINSNRIMAEWERQLSAIPGVQSLKFMSFEGGPPGAPIEIWIQGDDLAVLGGAAEDLKEKLRTYVGVYQVQSDLRPGKNEMQFRLKPEARALGITVADLATQVYAC